MSDVTTRAGSPREYVLGHSEDEIDRLKKQAALIDPLTRRFFADAGIAPGMRVLDVGSGVGDVAFLAAELVGSTGEVVGTDRSAAALEIARQRAIERSLSNVRFLDGDPAELSFDRPFDAVRGRYVLQFQADPGAMLGKLAAHVKPGGVVVFHEIDWGGLDSFPPVPTFDRCCQWGRETMRRHGTETRMGARLYAAFVSGGLAPPTMRRETLIAGPAMNSDILQLMARLIRTLLPQMEKSGVATATDVDLPSLVARIKAEAQSTNSVVIGHGQVAAWVNR
jgi:ubiquinone/menaquinone biosynthesis C-methylase UbiE